MKNEYCETCGSLAEYKGMEWEKFTFSHEEELVEIYECTNENCKEEFSIREEKKY